MKTKRTYILAVISLLLVVAQSFGQESNAGSSGPIGNIESGFYIKLGGSFPVGKFHDGQAFNMYRADRVLYPDSSVPNYGLTYLPAKIGPAMDMGFLIYIGPKFAKDYLRFGIDATFLSFWFNSTNPNTDGSSRYEKYYYFIGQKFGPVITVNPIEHLLLDLSYKINYNFGYHFDDWKDLGYQDADYAKYGFQWTNQEFSFNIRYRVMLLGFEYTFGKMTYDNFDDTRPKGQTISINNYKLMVGFKF